MTKLEVLSRLSPLVEQVLEISKFTCETSMDNTGSWTSLRHVRLLSAVERAFGIQIADTEAYRLTSGERLVAYVQQSCSAEKTSPSERMIDEYHGSHSS